MAEKGRTVFEVLKEHGKYFSAFCGGKGTCGKCRIQILGGSVPVTEQDRKFFRQEELAAGWRLALPDCFTGRFKDPFHPGSGGKL